MEQIEETANIMGDHVIKAIPFYEKTEPLTKDIVELIKNNTWRPTICVTGGEGLPETKSAGNVLRPFTRVKLSVRLPPLVDAKKAYERMIDAITKDVPYNAKVELLNTSIPSDGWNLEKYSTKLDNILNIASRRFFNNERKFFGEGGSIPFVQFFADLFPKADLAVMGVTGPGSNIHGPDENLDLTFCKNLICCITYLISDY